MSFPTWMPTSKENALYSIYSYLNTAFTGYTPIVPLKSPTLYSTGYQQAFTFPCITIEDTGMPDLVNLAMNDAIGGAYQGKRTQTIIKISIYDQNTDATDTVVAYPYAEQNVRRLRDLVRQALSQAGKSDYYNNLIMPVIPILDPVPSGLPGINTGQIIDVKTEEAGGWRDQFMANTGEQPNVKKYEIYVKIQWFEYTAWPSGLII